MKDIPELTGIRFVAAFIVCAYHFSPAFGLTSVSTSLQAPAMSAVSLFFILSGFILSYSYINKLDTLNVKYFFWARFARLAPAFLTVMLAMMPIRLLFLITSPESAKLTYGIVLNSPIVFFSWLANVFLVAVFVPMLNPWLFFWNPPAWSLTAEAVFYLSFPVVIGIFKKIERASLLILIAMILYGLLCLGIIGIFFWIMNIPATAFPLWFSSSLDLGGKIPTESFIRNYAFTYLIYLLPFLRCFEFWIGCAAGCVFIKLYEKSRLPQEKTRNLLLGISILQIYLAYQINNWTMGGMGLGIYAVYIPGFVLFIFTLACGKTLASSLLSQKLIVKLGKSSYALYISHYAGMAIQQNLANMGMTFPPGSYFIALGFCLMISLAIYYFVEVPGQQWLIQMGKARLKAT
jgi:peptidoglycan/LPS O-acetylase OafA/YrhL